MKSKLIKPWEEDAKHWSPEAKAAIKFAREDEDKNLFCVHPRGTVFEGEKAQMLISLGLAEQIADVEVVNTQRRLEE